MEMPPANKDRSFEIAIGNNQNERMLRVAPGESVKDAPFTPELVLVPPGTFWMGSKDGEGDCNEHPRHQVTIGYPLLVGKYPVTFDEWDAYVDGVQNGHTKPQRLNDNRWGRGRRPVINASWHHAQAYAAWLSHVTGKTYRLLSEAEWEYACRAGTETRYFFGDTITDRHARFWEGERGPESDDIVGDTVEVGCFPANAFGLHDMHGNVWEWCEDPWSDSYLGAPTDGAARPSSDPSAPRILRGGSADDYAKYLRAACREELDPDDTENNQGFRIARSV